MKKFIIPFVITFLFSILLSSLLSIRGVKPDFIIIFLIYFALDQGSFKGVVVGFFVGLLVSIFDNNPTIGILPLTYSIIGYGVGLLRNHKNRLSPIIFNVVLFSIILFGFFVYSYFLYDSIFYNNFYQFVINWFRNTIYTVTLIVIIQFIIPLRK